MRRILGVMLAGLFLTPPTATAGDLTLRDVMELHRTGLGDDLLIAVIDADGGPFRLSFVDIQDLKSDGLSERVIAALVRTGAQPLSADLAEADAEPVRIYQEIAPYVPAMVVVGVPVVPVWSDEHHRGRHAYPAAGFRRPQPPPATWVTRQQDGRNVTASGKVRSSVPAATWVTPRDPQSREPRSPDAPRPTPR